MCLLWWKSFLYLSAKQGKANGSIAAAKRWEHKNNLRILEYKNTNSILLLVYSII